MTDRTIARRYVKEKKAEDAVAGETGHPVVAVRLGVTVRLPDGRSVPYLACTRYSNAEGFLAERVNENSTSVLCRLCHQPHEIFSLTEAIEFDRLNVLESFVTISVSEIVALALRRRRRPGQSYDRPKAPARGRKAS